VARAGIEPATFRFSGGSPPEQVPFALVSVLRAGPFGPSGAAGLKVWPDFGRMDPSPRRPLGYELAGDSFPGSHASQTCRSQAVIRPNCAATCRAISSVARRFIHKSVHNPLPQLRPAGARRTIRQERSQTRPDRSIPTDADSRVIAAT
jgi:hypothetical protein